MFYKIGDALPPLLACSPFKSCIVPRPIAWVSTISLNGITNIAPFSYFNAVADTPPVLMFSCSAKNDGSEKDTMRNILATKEFVVNIVSRKNCEKMVATSEQFEYEVSEAIECDVPMKKAELVKPMRITSCLVALECRLLETIAIEVRSKFTGSTMILGEVVGIFVDDSAIKNGRIDIKALSPVARLGGDQYTEVQDIFTAPKLF